MNENNYLFYRQKENRYERLPKFSNEALQPFPGHLSVMLPKFVKPTTCRIVRKSAQGSGTNFLERVPGAKILKFGPLYVKNSGWAGPLKLLQGDRKPNIQNFLQAMKQFISGSTTMNASGSAIWFDLTADDCHEGILAGIKNFMSPREHRSKNDLHRDRKSTRLNSSHSQISYT